MSPAAAEHLPAADAAVLDDVQVFLDSFTTAGRICPRLDERTYLHAGPPLGPDAPPAPMRSALIGALLLEGAAGTPEQAGRLIDDGRLTLLPCADHDALGALTGIISRSMPVAVLRDTHGGTVFGTLGEGAGPCLRAGHHDPRTLDRLRWVAAAVLPLLQRACEGAELNVTRILRTALTQGDEGHSRTTAGTAHLLVQLTGLILKREIRSPETPRVLRWMSADPQFFGAFAVLTARLLARAIPERPGSPLLRTVVSNGHRVGIQVAGLGGRWFTAPAPVGSAVLFGGHSPADVHPVIGDSFAAEVAGFGAMALPAAPAATDHLGLSAARVQADARRMRSIASAESRLYRIPGNGSTGIPQGIDVHRVARSGITPLLATGLLHRSPGVGRIGAGLAELPVAPFLAASRALTGSD
ncbi:DUF1116 domain-containing protein [Kitasatospora sp. NPDC057015]|uniref:oxamate carbamoyltransferase subunit AllG family protein n=1 Tax=Kitasatospora sp. NPDC057015 TaxID=3346001 RepID=UPI003633F8A2